MSELGGEAENICSHRIFRILCRFLGRRHDEFIHGLHSSDDGCLEVQFHPAPYFRGFFALGYDPQIVQGQDRRRHMPLEQMK
jgi:hypothetical protein